MKNRYKALLISLLGSIFCSSVKADINYVTNFNTTTNNYELYKSTSSGTSQKLELLTTLSRSEGDMSGGWFDASQSKFYFAEYDDSSGYSVPTGKTRIYDLNSNTWSLVTLNNDSPDADPHFSSLTFSSSVVTEENNENKTDESVENKNETPEEILPNRLKLRRYLREFHLNQKRIVKVATEKALQEKLQKAKDEDNKARTRALKEQILFIENICSIDNFDAGNYPDN